ncbi:MAG: LexA repressor [Candidatus Binatia bacterium]|nr:MAG: LexA repressor [Candidatus Binatia bacterium]
MALGITKRQKQIYDFICAFLERHGYAPTIGEICAEFGLSSVATVHKHLTNLERRGWIRRQSNLSRSIEPLPRGRQAGAIELPLLGYVAAGAPIEAVEQEGTFAVPESFVRRPNCFVLRVRGDSMVEDGIWDGDYIIVEERSTADNGETVVALVRGEATVKRFYVKPDGQVSLVPAHPTMPPIEARADEVMIRGVVVAVLRKYV